MCRALIYFKAFCVMAKTKKQKAPTRSKLVKKADSVFSTFIRLRDSNRKWIVTCPLCWWKGTRKQAQNMHFITRACWLFRYDEDNCHAGCMRCNVILNWNYIAYTRYMQNKYWIEKVDHMIAESKKIHKLSTAEIQTIIDKYTNKILKFVWKLTE